MHLQIGLVHTCDANAQLKKKRAFHATTVSEVKSKMVSSFSEVKLAQGVAIYMNYKVLAGQNPLITLLFKYLK